MLYSRLAGSSSTLRPFTLEQDPQYGTSSTSNPNIEFIFNFQKNINTKRKASQVEHILEKGLMTEYNKDGAFRKKYFPATYYGKVIVNADVVRLERCTNCCYVAVDSGLEKKEEEDVDVDVFPLDRVVTKPKEQSPPAKRLKEDYYFHMTISLQLNGSTTQISKCYTRLEFASKIRNHQADEPDCYRLRLFTKNGATAFSSQGTISNPINFPWNTQQGGERMVFGDVSQELNPGSFFTRHEFPHLNSQ